MLRTAQLVYIDATFSVVHSLHHQHFTVLCVREFCADDKKNDGAVGYMYQEVSSKLHEIVPEFELYETSRPIYREFPWVPRVPWEFNGNGKYNSSFVGMGKNMGIAWREWEGNYSFPFPTQSRLVSLYVLHILLEERLALGGIGIDKDIPA